MAKELPYFKFYVSEWSDGDITLEDLETQGLFINVCSYYWSSECNVTLTKLKKKFRHVKDSLFNNLIDSEILKLDGDKVVINFLNEQQDERLEQSKLNSKAGKASAEARKRKREQQEFNGRSTDVQRSLDLRSTETQPLREEEIREDKNRKEDINNFKKWNEEEFKQSMRDVADDVKGMDRNKAAAFFNYWSEPDSKGKMKFQLQKTWDTKRRMVTWVNNNFGK